MTVVFGAKGENGREISRALLAAAVRRTWGWEQVPELVCSSRGKPEFSGVERKWLSLSHSGGYALCALSDDGPVGVDIEVIRPHREGLPRKVMTDREWSFFEGTWEDFARIWTQKESICKREDSPLYPPRNVQTPPRCPWRSFGGPDWWATVCCDELPPWEILWLENL